MFGPQDTSRYLMLWAIWVCALDIQTKFLLHCMHDVVIYNVHGHVVSLSQGLCYYLLLWNRICALAASLIFRVTEEELV